MKKFIIYTLNILMILSCITFPISSSIEAASVDVNIALNADVVVSGVEVEKFKADYVNDGLKPSDITNPTTQDNQARWSSNQTLPETPVWMYLDFGSVQTFSQINLYWQKADGTDFDIQISNDATAWESIQTITAEVDQVGRVDEIKFDTVQSAQYIRVYVRKGIYEVRKDVKGVSLYEVEVIQTQKEDDVDETGNLALNKTVVCSSVEANTSYTANLAVDGLKPADPTIHNTKDPNYPSRWSSADSLNATLLMVTQENVDTYEEELKNAQK